MRELLRTHIGKMLVVAGSAALLLASLHPTGIAGAAGETGKNPYAFGTSTYWAWQNRPDLPATLGQASNWDNNALAAGFPVGAFPRRGDIAVFEPGVQGADTKVGRVAMVEQVLEDGNYIASQMDDSD